MDDSTRRSAAEQALLGQAKDPAANATLPLGARVAGAVLLINAAANALTLVKGAGGGGPLASFEFKGMIVDLVVGGGLVAGMARLQKWAIVRVVLGGLLFGGIYAAQKDYVLVGLQLSLSAALLLLLIGRAGLPRMALGGALSVVYLLVAAAGVIQTYTGSNPAAVAILLTKGEISPASGTLAGARADYCLDVPPKQWFLRDPAVAVRDNPLSDRWITRPDLDAHVMVIAETLDESLEVDQGKLESVVLDEMKQKLTGFQDLGREPIPGGALLHVKGHTKNLDIEYYRGVFAQKNHAYQVIAFATPPSFARVEGELAALVRSFHTGCGPKAP